MDIGCKSLRRCGFQWKAEREGVGAPGNPFGCFPSPRHPVSLTTRMVDVFRSQGPLSAVLPVVTSIRDLRLRRLPGLLAAAVLVFGVTAIPYFLAASHT